MKILVTGGAGFIGSAVVRLAIARGHSVINVDGLKYAACKANVASVSDNQNYKFEHVDICDRLELERIFYKHSPDSVMHLAAQTHVDRSIDEPLDFIETNVIGTFNLLETAKAYWSSEGYHKDFRFHHVSTDEVFGSLQYGENVYFKEETPYDPTSPYSASKASSDHLVRAWHKTYGLPIILSNCSNNYGPYQFPEKLIPLTILNAMEGKPIPIYGDGKNIRDWLYVEDHADALLLVLENGKVGRSYNIGGDNQCENLQLVQIICSHLDRLIPHLSTCHSDLITFVQDRPGHDARYAIDSSRIRTELGWQPSVTLEEGLEKTVNWYLKNTDWWQSLLNKNGLGSRLGIKV